MLKSCLKSEQGYIIQITLILFAVLLVVLLIPKHYSSGDGFSFGCVLGDPPAPPKTITLPEIRDRDTTAGHGVGGAISGTSTIFHLVRANVLTQIVPLIRNFDNAIIKDPNEHSVEYQETKIPGFKIYYPGRWGEVSLKKGGEIFFREKGFIYLVHADDEGNPIIKDGAYVIDYYQDDKSFNDYKTGKVDYKYEDLFACDGNGGGVMVPSQTNSPDNKQLQLQWFVFKGYSQGILNAHCKPAVYLYPPQEELVNVKVEPSGYLTYTDPVYDSKLGWNVMAYPTGQLFNISKEAYHLPLTAYSYLYFESKIRDEVIKKPEKGWVVKYSELDNLYKDILPKLGLNPQQTKDFMEYWDKALDKTSPYYFVGVIDQNNVNQIEKLEITPKPDYINRVRIYFERLDNYKQVEAPQLTPYRLPLTANSFRVVEWGGMVKNDPSHPFTCSQ